MIARHYLHGQKLSVADLNEITVLIDRGETSLTEVGMNFWREKLSGPPHSHIGKEQVFFVTEGGGVIHVDGHAHQVGPSSLVYVPEGVVHQSVAGDEALTYFLFNAFLEPTKEGCASYEEHIEKVKSIRQRQADTGKATLDPEVGVRVSTKRPRIIVNAGGSNSAVLLARPDADGCEVERVSLRKAVSRTARHADREQTLFVLLGTGSVNVGGEEAEAKPGMVVFIPMDSPQVVTAGDDGLTYLSFSTFALPADN